MLASIRSRSLSVHATRSTAVPCRAPGPFRHPVQITTLKRSLQDRSSLVILKAAAEEAAAASEQAPGSESDAPKDDGSTRDRSSSSSSSKPDRKQQQQRRPRSSKFDRAKASKDSRMQPNTLFVNNLAWATLSEDLQEAFSSCKGFEDAFVMVGRDGRPAGYGFVRFGSEEAAAAAAEAMNDTELDGRTINVRFARPGKTDAAAADVSSPGNADSASRSSSSSNRSSRGSGASAQSKAAASGTESRVVVSNLPPGYTYREVFGMCSLFGHVNKVKLYSKGSSSSSGIDEDAAEQVEQDAAAVDGDAAAEEEEEQQQQQQQRNQAGGAAVVMMDSREGAERVIAELHMRDVQGSSLQARFYKERRARASKEATPAAAA